MGLSRRKVVTGIFGLALLPLMAGAKPRARPVVPSWLLPTAGLLDRARIVGVLEHCPEQVLNRVREVIDSADVPRGLGGLIRDDFSRVRVMDVDGWLLSETEVGLYALHARGEVFLTAG